MIFIIINLFLFQNGGAKSSRQVQRSVQVPVQDERQRIVWSAGNVQMQNLNQNGNLDQ